MSPSRVVVVGMVGSGKTTVSSKISRILDIPHIELDALFWGPDWHEVPNDLFLQRVRDAVSAPQWVSDGNYVSAGAAEIVWSLADTVVWLDLPGWIVWPRLLRRTFGRIITREELWSGNRESIRGLFFSRDSLFLWGRKQMRSHATRYPEMMSRSQYAHIENVIIRSRRELDHWLTQLSN